MGNKILFTFFFSEFLFVLSGGLLIGFSVMMQSQMTQAPSLSNVATNLLLARTPLTAGIANAAIIFVTFLFSIPPIIMPMSRGWLKVHGYMVAFCTLFSLILGLDIWFDTLHTRSNLLADWSAQPASSQSLLQQNFGCCGYLNSTSPLFITDTTCTSAIVAAQKLGCVGPFSSFANNYLDVIFTAAFGVVGVDVALILAIAMLLKDRKEMQRYRHIDMKTGAGGGF